jgi:uncharacterized protein (UPF0305 family)
MLIRLPTDREIMFYAINNAPSLILDCANPHMFYPHVNPDKFRETFVVPVDAIYRFRDTLMKADSFAESLNAGIIAITSYHRLYSYGDDEEKHNVLMHAEELIRKLAVKYAVVVKGLPLHPVQELTRCDDGYVFPVKFKEVLIL